MLAQESHFRIMEAVVSETQKKSSKLGKVVAISLVSLSAIGLGLGAGLYLHSQLKGAAEVQYETDADKYADAITSDQYLSNYKAAKLSGVVAYYQAKPYEAANTAFALYSQHEKAMAQGVGTGTAKVMGISVVQEIRSTVIRHQDHYFEESLSYSSQVNLADRMYQSKDVTRYQGKVVDGQVEKPASFDEGTSYSLDGYKEAMGRYVSTPCIYTISSKTTLMNDTTKSGEFTSFSENSDGYLLELELNPYRSVLHYVIQMQTISSLASKPTFTYVHLSFQLNKNFELISMSSHEYYYAAVNANVGSFVEGRMTTKYSTDGDYSYPAEKELTPLTYWDAK
jgi:hypothetical protein